MNLIVSRNVIKQIQESVMEESSKFIKRILEETRQERFTQHIEIDQLRLEVRWLRLTILALLITIALILKAL